VEPLVFSERESKDSLAEKGRAMLQLYAESVDGIKPIAVEQTFEWTWPIPRRVRSGHPAPRDHRSRGGGRDARRLKTAVEPSKPGPRAAPAALDLRLAYVLLKGSIPRLRLDMLLKTTKRGSSGIRPHGRWQTSRGRLS